MTGVEPTSAEGHKEAIAKLLRDSSRSVKDRKIGIEIERIGIWPDCTPFRYGGTRSAEGDDRPGAETLLRTLSETYGWPLQFNSEKQPLGLTPTSGIISLEPGSQVEMSTEADEQLDSLVKKAQDFEAKVDAVACPWGLTWIGLGVNPCNKVEDMDVIPYTRYRIMTEYLGKKARLATSMMRLTSSVQINLDYQSEEEGIDMLRAGLAAAPLSYAIFANSPLKEGKETGYLSYRYQIWQETDPDRAGVLHEAFADGFNFKSYADFLWDYPLMFAQDKNGQFVPANGSSLQAIFDGKLPNVIVDANNRMTAIRQLFTEARIKPGYVEIRSVDGQRPIERYAAAAFWMGILYDTDARNLVIEKLGHLSKETKNTLMVDCAKHGLNAQLNGQPIKYIAQEVLDAAKIGLERRGFGEEKYLEQVYGILRSGKTPAENVLDIFRIAETKKIKTVLAYASKRLTPGVNCLFSQQSG